MKIALDVAQTCQERAGCAWYADSLAKAMMEYAPHHKYTLYHQFADWHNETTTRGTLPIGKNVQTPFLNMGLVKSHETWRNILQGLGPLPGSPEIVHSTSFQAPKLSGTKLVFTVYDLSFWTVPEYTTESNRLACQKGILNALKNADGLAFISQSTKNEFDKIFPNWLEKSGLPWAVTPLGARASPPNRNAFPLYKYNIPPEGYWLSLGSLEPRKNIGTLLDAHEAYWQISQQKLPLIIAGGAGWKSNELKERIARLSQSGIVIPVGYVPDEELPSLYRKAKGLVFTSLYEGFGLPILEAFMHRCPVISGKHSSLGEVAENACLEINPLSIDDIVTAMIKLESSEGLAQALRLAGEKQAACFSWEKTATKTLDLYEDILRTSKNIK